MAKAYSDVYFVEKDVVRLSMGPKEAQSLRNLLARVSKDSEQTSDVKNIRSIRKALAGEGYHRSAETTLTGIVTA